MRWRSSFSALMLLMFLAAELVHMPVVSAEVDVLVVVEDGSFQEIMEEMSSSYRVLTGVMPHTIEAVLPVDRLDAVRSMDGVLAVYTDHHADTTGLPADASTAVMAWVHRDRGPLAPAEITDDVVVPEVPRAPQISPSPGYFDLSEYMIGSVAVAVVFPESNGSIDSNLEDWTNTEQVNVISEIQNGLNWLSARNPDAGLSFTLVPYYKQNTSYEPITRNSATGSASSNMWVWINEIMRNLGANGTGIAAVRDFANKVRNQVGSDWAYVIFVADSSADSDNQFADGKFAFAALGGPYVVMTYGNDGYGINNMDAVVAHESCHIFYALDEYLSAGTGTSARSGYLNVQNLNDESSGSSVPCIMRGGVSPFSSNAMCPYTRGQIGWNDTDGDHIPDVLDTVPRTSLDQAQVFTNRQSLYITGNASVNPLPNRNPFGPGNAVTLNTITMVEYSLDGGAWTPAVPVNGTWGNASEAFRIPISSLSEGGHSLRVRATNSVGNVEGSYPTATIVADYTPPTSYIDALPEYARGTVRLNWHASDAVSGVREARIYYSVNNGPWQFYTATNASPVMFAPPTDGYYRFRVLAVDRAGNMEDKAATWDAYTIVDVNPPITRVLQPEMYTGEPWTLLDFTATDGDGVGVARVELFWRLNYGPWHSLGNYSVGPVRFQFGDEGVYEFFSMGTDLLGNREDAPAHPDAKVIFDATPPEVLPFISGTQGSNGWWVSQVGLTLTSEDGTVYWNSGDGWNEYTETVVLSEEGRHNVSYYAVDAAGNRGETQYTEVYIDLYPPQGRLHAPGYTTSTTAELEIDAWDSASGVQYMKVSMSPTLSDTDWISFSSRYTIQLLNFSGTQIIYASFMDHAGRMSGVVSTTVTLDRNAPTVRITHPGDGMLVYTPYITVNGTASDDGALEGTAVVLSGTTYELGADPNWSTTVRLMPGNNTVCAVAEDLAGNRGMDCINITYWDGPLFEITSPVSGEVSSGIATLKGTIAPGLELRINGQPVHIAGTNISYNVALQRGRNVLDITAEANGKIFGERILVLIYTEAPVVVSDIRHYPRHPYTNTTVHVECRAEGAEEVVLYYRSMGGTLRAVPMEKTGDVYTAEMGPFAYDVTVRYYIEADGVRYPQEPIDVKITAAPTVKETQPAGQSIDDWIPLLLVIIIGIIGLVIMSSVMGMPQEPARRPPQGRRPPGAASRSYGRGTTHRGYGRDVEVTRAYGRVERHEYGGDIARSPRYR